MKTNVAIFMLAAALSAQETLPPGPGRTIVLEACVQCHDTRAITSQQKSESAWRRTINEMIWRGAPLMPGEADVLVKYLTTPARPPRSPLSAPRSQTKSPLPPGRGRELVMGACVQCHPLEITTTQRKTRDEWRQSVEQMARLGAKLNGTELQIVTNYLSTAFGPDRRPSS